MEKTSVAGQDKNESCDERVSQQIDLGKTRIRFGTSDDRSTRTCTFAEVLLRIVTAARTLGDREKQKNMMLRCKL